SRPGRAGTPPSTAPRSRSGGAYLARVGEDVLELVTPGPTLRARLLRERAPGAVAAITAHLPFEATLMIDEWSGFVARIRPPSPISAGAGDEIVAFAYPGLVMLDPATGDLAICFGQGRLQNGLGPQPAIPVMEIGG